MRVPHTVPYNTLKAYEASYQTLDLVGERGRQLRAEDWTWDENTPPSLVEESIRSLVSDFDEHKRVLPFLEEDNIILLLETLPTSLPLEIVIPLIPDGIYWKRRCNDSWPTMNDVTRYDDSWKRMFTERYIEDLIESEEPGYTDWTEVQNTLKLCCPYIKRLDVSQLQPPRVMEHTPLAPDQCNTEEFIPEHLDLSPFLTILENLLELDLQFGVKGIGMKFTFKCFKTHIKDVERLAKGLRHSKKLRKLRISCSDIDDEKLNIILKSLEQCEQFEELEIAHCKITNVGAMALGYFMCIMPSLKHLKIQNNSITTEGAQGLSCALTKQGRAEIETLDLKFNLIGEEGGKYVATALAKSTCPRNLILAGCGLKEEAGTDLVNMLKVNTTLKSLDLSNNALGTEVGYMMSKGIEKNLTILHMDVRNCGFDEECEKIIHHLTFRNREKVRKDLESGKPGSAKWERRATSFVNFKPTETPESIIAELGCDS